MRTKSEFLKSGYQRKEIFMDKERMLLESEFLWMIAKISDEKKQKEVIDLLQSTEEKIPDSRLKDKLQKMLRRNKNYCDKSNALINDILDTKLDASSRMVILDCLKKLKKISDENQQNLWDIIMEGFDNATGKN